MFSNLKKFWLIAVFLLIFVSVAGAMIYEYYGGSLSSGTYEDTFYNESGFVQLNASGSSYVEEGNYTSTIMDFGGTTGFAEISWKGNRSCPEGMAYIDKLGGYCIDKYEAYNAGGGVAGSAEGESPWTNINQGSAKDACAAAGKHLCSSAEWLGAANIQGQVYNLPDDLAVEPYGCNTDDRCGGSACVTGSNTGCVSAEGVYDMVGNVREWTAEVVDTIKPCNVGSDGYCYPQSDGSWGTSGDSYYGSDGVYFKAGNNSGRAVLRGGDWTGGADAGPFFVALRIEPTDSISNIGFRCCQEPLD